MVVGKWPLLGGVIIAGVVVLYAGYRLAFGDPGALCGFEPKEQRLSPEGDLKAAILRGSCGATTGNSSVVVLTEVSKPLDFDTDRIASFHGVADHVVWSGRNLLVTYNGAARPTKALQHYRGVAIRYAAAP